MQAQQACELPAAGHALHLPHSLLRLGGVPLAQLVQRQSAVGRCKRERRRQLCGLPVELGSIAPPAGTGLGWRQLKSGKLLAMCAPLGDSGSGTRVEVAGGCIVSWQAPGRSEGPVQQMNYCDWWGSRRSQHSCRELLWLLWRIEVGGQAHLPRPADAFPRLFQAEGSSGTALSTVL